MYHDEQIINDVLCWRNSPDAEWTPYTIQELSARIERMSRAIHDALQSLHASA